MKITAKISLVFAILILLQSCSIYRNKNISIEEAAQSEKRVRIKTKDDETLKFKKILFLDGAYYGVKATYKGEERILLQPDSLLRIQPQNKGLSILVGAAATVVTVFVVSVLVIGVSGGFTIL